MLQMTNKPRQVKLPKQTVVNAFVMFRVPRHGSITYSELHHTLLQDIEAAKADGFDFFRWCRLSLDAALRFILSRHLLSTGDLNAVMTALSPRLIGHIGISWNERTERYVRRLPKRVSSMLDKLPSSNILILLAGATKD